MPDEKPSVFRRLVARTRRENDREWADVRAATSDPRAEGVVQPPGDTSEERYVSELTAFVERTLVLPTSPPETKSRYGDIIAPLPGRTQSDDLLELWGAAIEEEFQRLVAEPPHEEIWEAARFLGAGVAMPGKPDHDLDLIGALLPFIWFAYCWRTAELRVFKTDPATRVQTAVVDCLPAPGLPRFRRMLLGPTAYLAVDRGIAFEYGVVSGSLGPELTRFGITRVALRHYEITSAEIGETHRWKAFTCGLALRHAEIALQEAS